MTAIEHWTEPRHYTTPKGELYGIRIYHDGREVCAVNVRDPQCEERAHLIAAAPESAAACEMFIAWVDSGAKGFPDEAKLIAAVKHARAALAKAAGGQS